MTKLVKNEFSKETQDWSKFYSNAGVSNAIPCMDLDERLRKVEERLLLVTPSEVSRYPALAAAYQEYKLIERIILGNEET